MGEEGTKLVGDERNAVEAGFVVHLGEFARPELAHCVVCYGGNHLLPELLVDEEWDNVPQARIGLSGSPPLLAINPLNTKSEKDEQKGFATLLKAHISSTA